MPLVGGTVTVSGNVSDWSHSTVFTTTTSTFETKDVPALTSAWVPLARCANRWVAKPEPVTVLPDTISIQTTVDVIGTLHTYISFFELETPVTTGFIAFNSATEDTEELSILSSFVAFSTKPASTSGALFDPLYSSCQPYGLQPQYSPGICPDGQTVAEVTEYQYSGTAGSQETYFEASCCQSGLSFRSELPSTCIGEISTPFEIYAPFTTYLDGQTESSTVIYEYIARSFVASTYGTDGFSTTTFSNISTATAGLIAADPLVVGWQRKDLSAFPTDYVSSLVQRYSMSWDPPAPPSPTPASSSGLPRQTNPPTSELSTGAKAGISVGTILGVTLLATAMTLLLLRRRRKVKNAATADEGGIMPEMEDQEAIFAKKKWYLRGRWRNELPVEVKPQELDSTTVNVVPGSPIELDGAGRQFRDTDVRGADESRH